MIQAILQISLFSHHRQHSKMTSGALYYRVLIMGVWRSSAYVAPPKSMTLTSQERGLYQALQSFWKESELESREEEDF